MNDSILKHLYMLRIFIPLSLLFLGASCNMVTSGKDNYLKNPKISSIQGLPADSLTFYLPGSISHNTDSISTGINTFMLDWFSSALYAAKEPVLYNYYLGHDIYRFLWLRSFHRPVIISLHKNKDQVWLIAKVLNKQPDFLDEVALYVKFVAPDSANRDEHPKEIIKKADRKATIVIDKEIPLTKKDWKEFEGLLNKCSFWKSQPFIERIGIDGSEWTIEAHLRNRYWFVNRWSPEDDLRKAGEFLIRKSELKEEVY
jgi:hypothetical protein